MSRHLVRLFVVALAGVTVTGCGSNNGLDLARVSGKVTYKGEPITNGTIMFEPDEAKGATGPQAIGTILKDGTYTLSSGDGGDGAVVGFHKVGILGLAAEPSSAEAAPSPEDDPLKFLAAKTKAGMEATRAKKGAAKTVTGLDGRPFAVIVPDKFLTTQSSGIVVEVVSGSNNIDIDIQDDEVAKVNK